ncbi:transcriptional regulator [Cupriavidus pauculus]|uniref:Transcriptional regulator n=2 Tax=Cupriavidus pauculus TaxID=82633 RepID=A0A2N5C6R6_9BURK|nr:transcriptional regulator [Cupriavidus pauculus]
MEKTIHSEQYAHLLALLRSAREAAELTQIQLASRLGETQSFVSKCERGERRLDLIELRLWCAAIGVPLIEFVTRLEQAVGRSSRR